MSAKPTIHFVRPLLEIPALHAAIVARLREVDPSRANLIGADAREYVHVPSDGAGFLFVEVVYQPDGDYALVAVEPARARAIFNASTDYRRSLRAALPN